MNVIIISIMCHVLSMLVVENDATTDINFWSASVSSNKFCCLCSNVVFDNAGRCVRYVNQHNHEFMSEKKQYMIQQPKLSWMLTK